MRNKKQKTTKQVDLRIVLYVNKLYTGSQDRGARGQVRLHHDWRHSAVIAHRPIYGKRKFSRTINSHHERTIYYYKLYPLRTIGIWFCEVAVRTGSLQGTPKSCLHDLWLLGQLYLFTRYQLLSNVIITRPLFLLYFYVFHYVEVSAQRMHPVHLSALQVHSAAHVISAFFNWLCESRVLQKGSMVNLTQFLFSLMATDVILKMMQRDIGSSYREREIGDMFFVQTLSMGYIDVCIGWMWCHFYNNIIWSKQWEIGNS